MDFFVLILFDFSSVSILINIIKFFYKFYGFVKKYKMKILGFNLGEIKDSLMYIVSMFGGYYGKVYFYSGFDVDCDFIIVIVQGVGKFFDYFSDISFFLGVRIYFKYSLGNLKYDFELLVGFDSNMEQFQWKGIRVIMGGMCKFMRMFIGEVMVIFDEGRMGLSLGLVFEFIFEEQVLDGSLGVLFFLMVVFMGVRCWQMRKYIKYLNGVGGGVVMVVVGC